MEIETARRVCFRYSHDSFPVFNNEAEAGPAEVKATFALLETSEKVLGFEVRGCVENSGRAKG